MICFGGTFGGLPPPPPNSKKLATLLKQPLVSQSVNRLINQSINQITNQINQNNKHPINYPISQSVNQSINQSVSQIMNHSFPLHCYIKGNTRPAQDCPITNDLVFNRCLSPCRSSTCADLRKEPRSGTRPCVRMCVSGWACPRGQYLLDGYADVCVKKKACRKRIDASWCIYENATIPVSMLLMFFSDVMTHNTRTHRQLRARRVLILCKNVPLRTRKALTP